MTGVCTACGAADTEVNDEMKCVGCAGAAPEAATEEAAPAAEAPAEEAAAPEAEAPAAE